MEQIFSRETPQARVEWHLACLDARRRGDKEPPAPWEQKPHTPSQQNGEALVFPPRHGMEFDTKPPRIPRVTSNNQTTLTPHAPTVPELSAEKKLSLEYLLLRGGVPREIVAAEGRATQVYEAYRSFVQQGGERSVVARLNKYEIGRHFLVGSGAQRAIDVADAMLPLLAANSANEVAARERSLLRFVDDLAARANFPRRPTEA